ncbi:hypothetical protein ABPG72_008251 [Tetrahymena utriculariae]
MRSAFSRLLLRFQKSQLIQNRNFNILGGLFALSTYQGINLWNQYKVQCDNIENQNPKPPNQDQDQTIVKNIFNSEEIRKRIMESIVLIYSDRTSKPIATGIVIDDEGTFITISNIFDLDSKHPSHQLYAKSIREEFEDTEFPFSIEYTLESENISFCKIKKQTQNQILQFKKANIYPQIPSIGKRVYLFGKSNQDFNVIEEGILNENKLSSELAFDFSAQSLLLMANIQNKYTSLYGGPIFDEYGNILAMNYPIPNSFIKSHVIGIPCYYLGGIIQQYQQKKEVRKPYVGVSVKWTSDIENGGAFILKVNSDSPGAKADLKLGEIITEVNDIKIKDGKDLARILGYSIGQHFKLKVFRNGKSRFVTLVTE